MAKLIDLTHTVRPGMRGVDVRPKFVLDRDGWNAATWELYSHSGTHCDAPIHFGAHPITIDQMPLDLFCGPAWIAHIENVQPKQLLVPADLGEVEDSFEAGGCLLLHTGWAQYVDDASIWRDGLPRISDELAQWCIDRKVKLLGVEPPSVADVNNLPEVTRIHKTLLGAQITIVEGLCNLDKLPQRAEFQAFPLKLESGDGCPVRAVATID